MINNSKSIKIGIVGGGNIGRTLSVLLMSNGFDVEVVCRSNHSTIKIDNSYVFEIKGDFGDKSYLIPYVKSIEELSSKKDIIIYTTKSYDMINRVHKCLKFLKPTGTIVTIQNIYTIDKLYELIPPESSVCMVCDFGCKTIDKVTYVKDSNGITLGVYNKKAINRMKLVEKLLKTFCKVSKTKDIVGFCMGRNIINGTISVLGGVSGLNLKDMLSCKEGRYLFCSAILECYNICCRSNINVLPYNETLDYKKFCESSIMSLLYRKNIIKKLRVNNGNIKSSALDDLENGRKTEIMTLVDTMLAYGKKTSSCIQTISYLGNMLKEIEGGQRTINVDNLKMAYDTLKIKK